MFIQSIIEHHWNFIEPGEEKKDNWTWVKGAFHTVDRPYGPLEQHLTEGSAWFKAVEGDSLRWSSLIKLMKFSFKYLDPPTGAKWTPWGLNTTLEGADNIRLISWWFWVVVLTLDYWVMDEGLKD